MGKAAAYVRRKFKLDHKLRNYLFQCSTLVDASDLPAIPADSSRARPCLALGVCICTEHPDVGFFCVNLSLYCRKTFWKKKENFSPERVLLDSFLLVMEFKQSFVDYSADQTAGDVADLAISKNTSEWDLALEHQQSVVVRKSSLFVHIGRIDLRNWHFSALCMVEAPTRQSACSAASDVMFLQPLTDDKQQGVYSDVEIFSRLLDLSTACSLRLHYISLKEEDWLNCPTGSIAVRPCNGNEEFMFWQGARAETDRRRSLQQLKPRKRKQVSKQSSKPKAKRTAKKRQKASVEIHPLEDDHDDESVDDEILPHESVLDMDSMLDALVPGLDPEENQSEEEQESEHDPADEHEQNEKEGHGEGSYYEPSLARSSELDPSDLAEIKRNMDLDSEDSEEDLDKDVKVVSKFLNTLAAPPEIPAQPLPSQLESLESQPQAEPLPPPQPAPEQAVPDAKVPVDRPSGISRSTLNRDVIEVGRYGELHYYHVSEQMVAFCGLRSGKHFDNCRKQITTNPARRGSGRPIGALVCWLMEQDKYETKASHVHCSSAFPWEERRAARTYFEKLLGAQRFLNYEKPKAGFSEDDEPRVV